VGNFGLKKRARRVSNRRRCEFVQILHVPAVPVEIADWTNRGSVGIFGSNSAKAHYVNLNNSNKILKTH
jgi:hypothetical protein